MPLIEFIYMNGCPQVEETKLHLQTALKELGLPADWIEWEKSNPNAPTYVMDFGSPTILINGNDIANQKRDSNSECCRLYELSNGKLRGAPSVESIIRAIQMKGI